VSIRIRLFLALLIPVGLGFFLLVDWILDDLRPRYLETMEETMVDTATILAAQLSVAGQGAEIPAGDLRATFTEAGRRTFEARIYQFTKTRMAMRVYVTDDRGIVLFDSDQGRDEGKDYSRWNDVVRTLRGEYGARATPIIAGGDPKRDMLFVASPIVREGRIIGVVSVGKPEESIDLFLTVAKGKIARAGLLTGVAAILSGLLLAWWITIPIRRLTDHARLIRDGQRPAPPSFGETEIGQLGEAFEEMRDALEGKQYVERYVQTLTHEMKGPLSAIRGAAELLGEEMPEAQRRRFLENIAGETARLRDLVDRLLSLSSLEARKGLEERAPVAVGRLAREIAATMINAPAEGGVSLVVTGDESASVMGDPFLLRLALTNLIQNARDFSPPGATVEIALAGDDRSLAVTVLDRGPGVPDYALERIFDRFYSLPRPGHGRKGTGLGLPIVREIAHLHGGEVTLVNRDGGGARATLTLPRAPAS
jgi:two-component system sensor histidine kinase CreC